MPTPSRLRIAGRLILGLIAGAILAAGAAGARAGDEGGGQEAGEPRGKALASIPAATLALIRAAGSEPGAPILLRAYKKEAEIELWKRTGEGRFVRIKTYPICRWSGQLGPKTREGDRQTPEGFYSVARGQMNPNSRYYLSFDLGYPNAYDRAHGATGSAVMVHGICSSMGCFAMTDAVAGELFALAREAFRGGQGAFQFQSYPFRMTAENMARHRTDPNIGFWRQLKEGSDRFEATGLEPVVAVVAGRYGFAPLADPIGEAHAGERVRAEAARVAALVADGAAAVRTTYSDGGQHPFWAALIGRGASVGEVSRPEALAYAGQEVVLIPARHRPVPVPVPASVWTAWIALGPPSAPSQAAFRPAYETDAPPGPSALAAAFSEPLSTGYGASLPRLVRAALDAGLRGDPDPLPPAPLPHAERASGTAIVAAR